MQRKVLLLSVTGVVVLVSILVGGCDSWIKRKIDDRMFPPDPRHEAVKGTWWLNPVPDGLEYVKLEVATDGTWTETEKTCEGGEESSAGSLIYPVSGEVYTLRRTVPGQPDELYAEGTVANDTFTLVGGEQGTPTEWVKVFTRTQPTSPCS